MLPTTALMSAVSTVIHPIIGDTHSYTMPSSAVPHGALASGQPLPLVLGSAAPAYAGSSYI